MSGAGLELALQVERGEFALRAELALPAGITALFGPSGSGKTTLLLALAGLLRRRDARVRGRVTVGGRVLLDSARGVDVPPWRRRVGLVFQDLRLFPHLSVEGNLCYGHRPAAAGPAVGDVVAELGLDALLARLPGELSGGERQRVALGRALLAGPELLLMDEPLASIDVGRRRHIIPYLDRLHRRLGIPVLYVSHALPEIVALTDRVVVLDGGRVAGSGEVFDALGRASAELAAGVLDTGTVIEVDVRGEARDEGTTAALLGGQPVVLPLRGPGGSSSSAVAIRPEDVVLATERVPRISARNQLAGTIARITPLHGRLLVHVAVGDAVLRAEVTADAAGELGLAVGAAVWCLVKTSAFRWV